MAISQEVLRSLAASARGFGAGINSQTFTTAPQTGFEGLGRGGILAEDNTRALERQRLAQQQAAALEQQRQITNAQNAQRIGISQDQLGISRGNLAVAQSGVGVRQGTLGLAQQKARLDLLKLNQQNELFGLPPIQMPGVNVPPAQTPAAPPIQRLPPPPPQQAIPPQLPPPVQAPPPVVPGQISQAAPAPQQGPPAQTAALPRLDFTGQNVPPAPPPAPVQVAALRPPPGVALHSRNLAQPGARPGLVPPDQARVAQAGPRAVPLGAELVPQAAPQPLAVGPAPAVPAPTQAVPTAAGATPALSVPVTPAEAQTRPPMNAPTARTKLPPAERHNRRSLMTGLTSNEQLAVQAASLENPVQAIELRQKILDNRPSAIAKRKAAETLGTQRGKNRAKLSGNLSRVRILRNSLRALETHPDLKSATGFVGGALSKFAPGTPQFAVGRLFDQVYGGVFLKGYQELKGGGHITDVEGGKAAEAHTDLSRFASHADVLNSILKLRAVVNRAERDLYVEAGTVIPKQLTVPQGVEANTWDSMTQQDKRRFNEIRFRSGTPG